MARYAWADEEISEDYIGPFDTEALAIKDAQDMLWDNSAGAWIAEIDEPSVEQDEGRIVFRVKNMRYRPFDE